MQAETHFELSSLIESVNSSLDDYDTVSLDLFDTLFIRRIHEPDEIKRPVAIFISNVARQYGIDISFSRTWQIRNEIEQQHRNRNGKHFPDFEARYEDFMKEVLSDIFEKQVPTGFLEEVIAYELRIETSMLVVREEFARWLKYLKEQKKRVLIISDIYHSSSFLELFCLFPVPLSSLDFELVWTSFLNLLYRVLSVLSSPRAQAFPSFRETARFSWFS